MCGQQVKPGEDYVASRGFQAYARLSVEPADVLVAALNEEAIMEDEDSEGEVALCAGRGVRGVTVERAVASDAGKPVEGA